MSSGSPKRAEGIFDIIASLNLSSSLSVIAVLMKPGDIQFILIFFLAYSIAKLFDIAIMPALEAV